jgi:DHA2 family multidrug resistance protein
MFTAEHPFISPALFKDRNFVICVTLIFMLGVLLLGSMALVTPFLQSLLGYPVITAGLTLAPRGIGTMTAMVIVGRLIARIDARLLLLFGLTLMIHTLWQMGQFTADEPQAIVCLNGLEQGFGLGFLFVPISTVTFSTLPATLRAEGAAIYSLARNVGGAIGISIFATMLDRGTQQNHAEIAAYVTPFNRMLDFGTLSGPDAGAAAMALDARVLHEASTIAYLDDFRVMTVLGLLLVPMALLLRIEASPATGAALAAHE